MNMRTWKRWISFAIVLSVITVQFCLAEGIREVSFYFGALIGCWMAKLSEPFGDSLCRIVYRLTKRK
jgi:hypothetical protein